MADDITWINADGVEYSITQNHLIIAGSDGRFMPPIDLVEEDVPFQAGSRLRDIKVKARDIDIPIYVEGVDEMDLRKKLRNLLKIINPMKGEGRLRCTAIDGTQREIYCRYKGGMEISEKGNAKIGNLQALVILFRAFDPYWYDANTIVKTFEPGQPATFFPFFPLRLSSSTVFADTSIENTGDVETWPEWIIKGPGENILIRNLTTGDVIHLEHPDAKLGVGESIIINTTPRPPKEKTVTKNDGTNLFYTLSDESSLWALQEDVNNIRLEMSNTTSDSSIQLTYRNRYWGP